MHRLFVELNVGCMVSADVLCSSILGVEVTEAVALFAVLAPAAAKVEGVASGFMTRNLACSRIDGQVEVYSPSKTYNYLGRKKNDAGSSKLVAVLW